MGVVSFDQVDSSTGGSECKKTPIPQASDPLSAMGIHGQYNATLFFELAIVIRYQSMA